MSGTFTTLASALRAEEPVAIAEVVEGPPEMIGAKLLVRLSGGEGDAEEVVGGLGDADLDRVVLRDMRGELAAGLTVTRHYGRHGEARAREVSVFIESFAPPPQMIIFGAVDFTAALARLAKILGYRVTVCDARPVFATPARFPMADEVVVDWPDRHLAKVADTLGQRDVVCVLTHDPKFD
ncbi:MAG: XshC-Cox1 family protein, partial [Candidatus Aeolococcus gillhamiae]